MLTFSKGKNVIELKKVFHFLFCLNIKHQSHTVNLRDIHLFVLTRSPSDAAGSPNCLHNMLSVFSNSVISEQEAVMWDIFQILCLCFSLWGMWYINSKVSLSFIINILNLVKTVANNMCDVTKNIFLVNFCLFLQCKGVYTLQSPVLHVSSRAPLYWTHHWGEVPFSNREDSL